MYKNVGYGNNNHLYFKDLAQIGKALEIFFKEQNEQDRANEQVSLSLKRKDVQLLKDSYLAATGQIGTTIKEDADIVKKLQEVLN